MQLDFNDRDRINLETNCGSLMMEAVNDSEVIEIMLNPDSSLWVEKYGRDHERIGNLDAPQARQILSLVASAQGNTVSYLTPIVEGLFPLDSSRFEGVFPPLTTAPSFSLRKRASRVFTLPEYQENGSIQAEGVNIIEQGIAARKNIVVVGGTSSGKTTFLNAVIDAITKITPSDRIVTLEDTPELQCTSENLVSLYTSEVPGAEVSMRKLAKVCMRYAPKRILVGEVRDAAALELLKLWNTGHPGGIATFHADSAFEALERLEELVEEAGLGPKQRLIGRAVDLVVYMEKTRENRRVVSNIMQVDCFDAKKQEYVTQTLYAA